jgi:hypothetical protein
VKSNILEVETSILELNNITKGIDDDLCGNELDGNIHPNEII